MIQLYGSPRTSASRCYWMLEELGLPYEQVPLDMKNKEHKSATFLKINPNGKVPVLVDGSFSIWESMAINYYLAEKYRPEILGKTPEQKGLVQQWSYWSILELQKPAIEWLIQDHFVAADKKDLGLIEKCKKVIPSFLEILDNALAHQKYLAGDLFTLADLNTASVVNICLGLNVDIGPWKNLSHWMQMCKERPAFQKLVQLRS